MTFCPGTFPDAHQDCFSERFCGEGVPLWAAANDTDFPEPLAPRWVPEGPEGVPSTAQCAAFGWGLYQLTRAGAAAYERLYTNDDGLRDRFAAFWGVVAARFRGAPNVLGMELLNEPFAGDFYRDPALMYPGRADRVRLQPFYDAVAPVLRENDPDRLIMFESCTWSDEFGAGVFDSEFEHAPGGAAFGNRSLYSYHYYPGVNLGDARKYFAARKRDYTRWGAAGFVTGGGSPSITGAVPAKPLSRSCSSETNADAGIFAVADEFVQSWAIWEVWAGVRWCLVAGGLCGLTSYLLRRGWPAVQVVSPASEPNPPGSSVHRLWLAPVGRRCFSPRRRATLIPLLPSGAIGPCLCRRDKVVLFITRDCRSY